MIKPNCRAHYAIGKPRTVLPQMLPRNELKRSGDYFCSDPLYYWLTNRTSVRCASGKGIRIVGYAV